MGEKAFAIYGPRRLFLQEIQMSFMQGLKVELIPLLSSVVLNIMRSD